MYRWKNKFMIQYKQVMKMKIGLALSGGGVKGAAHIGVIQALLENEIPIDIVGGTSSGSIVAALYAMGYQPEEILKLFQYFSKMILKGSPTYVKPSGRKTLSIQVGGLLSGDSISYVIEEAAKYKKVRKMKELPITIVIPTVDVETSKKYIFTNAIENKSYYIKNVKIDTAVRASCSYPGVFAPCLYKEFKFVDGGVLDNIPVDEVKSVGADFIIASKFFLNRKAKTKGIVGVVSKSIDIMFDKYAKKEIEQADYVLSLNTKNTMVFDIKRIHECYQYGYEQTKLKIDAIKQKIEEKKVEEKNEKENNR